MMKIILPLILLCLPAATTAQTPWAEPGPHMVTVIDQVWRDDTRDRELPIRLYQPDGDGPFPVIVFSHGLGGSREAAPYLGRHWASWGFVGVFIQHPGTDRSLWEGSANPRQALQRGARNPGAGRDRFNDIPFILDQIEASSDTLNADTARMGVAGHSYGAMSVMAALGRTFGPRDQFSFNDDRLTAGVALSPPPASTRTREGAVYSEITEPVLHVTGRFDGSPLDSDVEPGQRLEAFRVINSAPQYLIYFNEADHSVFSGNAPRPSAPHPESYAAIQAATAEASTAFFLAWLASDARARAFMDGAAFVERFDPLADVERRNQR